MDKDLEEEDLAAASSTNRALTAKEWKQIEAVSQAVRQVGASMQAEAKVIAVECTDQRNGENGHGILPFCNKTWCWLQEGLQKKKAAEAHAPASINKAKKKQSGGGGKATLMANLEIKTREDLLARVRTYKEPGSPAPRLEAFGKRTEGFAKALETWALSRGRPSLLDVVVSCSRGAALLESRCGEAGREAAQALISTAVACAEKFGGVDELLAEAVTSPEPLVKPSFHGAQQVSLYPEQKEVARALGISVLASKPLLLRYVTPPSGGKSSAAALFGATLEKILEAKQRRTPGALRRPPCFVIYACFSNAVRVEVARTVLSASVPFAVVSGGLASPSFRCYHSRETARGLKEAPPLDLKQRVEYSVRLMQACDRVPVVLVCDLDSALAFCGRQHQGGDDVLLLDEMTVGSEPTVGSQAQIAKAYSKLLRRAPRYTVLMSATVPEFDDLPSLLRTFGQLHGNFVQETVSSRRLSIGVEARDAEGTLWLPHHLGGLSAEALMEDGHLLRFYGPEGLRLLLQELRLDPKDILHIQDFASHDTLRQAVLRVFTNHSNRVKDLPTRTPPEHRPRSLEAIGLATTEACRHPGCTLVVSSGGAEAFFLEAMEPLLENVLPVRRLMVKNVKEKKERSRKPDSDEDERQDPQQPEIQLVRWPAEAVVNSKEHLAKHGTVSLQKKDHKCMPQLPAEILQTSATPLVESALAGAVLLDSKWGDRAFELCGLALADSAVPSYVVSDTRMVYGVNLPVNRVLVLLGDEDLGLEEVRQLCGRAGRTGKCSKAEVIFRSPNLLRLALLPKKLATGRGRAPLDLLLEKD